MTQRALVGLVLLATGTAPRGQAGAWPFAVTDLRARGSLTILVFGDSGTGREGQARVGEVMADVGHLERVPAPGPSEE